MKKTFKKTVSLLLSLLMLLSVFGGLTLPARAAESTGWASSDSLPTLAGSYVLTTDIALSDPWYPIDGITIDLNGHRITSSGSYDHFIIVQNGVTFTLNDGKKDSTDPADKHYYNISGNIAVLSDSETGNYFIGGSLYGINRPSSSVGGAVYVEAGGNFVMNGGTILGHRYLVDGGGVFVRGKNEDEGLPDGVFTMNDGNIIGNHNRWGAGVYNQGVFNFNGGTIRQNYSDWGGGAVLNHGTVNMNGGTISENGSIGVAGICVFIGTLNLNGGAIINNASSRDEGGVGGGAEKNISGSPVVSGNTSRGSASNLTPSGDRPITITGPLTCSEPIHITTNADVSSGRPVVLTSGWETYMGDADINDYFVLDNGSYRLITNPNGEIQIVDPSLTYYYASFDPGEGSGEMNDIYAIKLSLPENGFAAPAGKALSGWLSGADGNTYAVGDSVTLSGDATFTAQWTDAVYAYLEPGEAEGETVTHSQVLPGTAITLPANPYPVPAGKLFTGWSDGSDIYQPGNTYTLDATTTFAAQWADAVYAYLAPGEAEGETVVFREVLSGKRITLPLNPYAAPEGKLFTGWSDGSDIYQPGNTYTLNATTTFTAQWADAVYAYLAPGDAEGETVAFCAVLPGTEISLPANPYAAPEGMLFTGWSDGESTFAEGSAVTLDATTVFTAQWAPAVTVTFNSEGGSAVASQVIAQNTAVSEPAAPVKSGFLFSGWRLDGAFFDFAAPVTRDITLHAVWIEGISVEESFSDSSMPAGWTAEGDWRLSYSNYNGTESVQPHSGEYMAFHPYYNSSRLTMPVMDLSGQSAVLLSFWYQNCFDGSSADNLIVSYRVNGGEWAELFRTTEDHKTWTQATVALPEAALSANVEISFYADVNYGWGVFLDDVALTCASGHEVAYSAAENVLTAACSNDPCAWEENALTLTLNAPAKTVYGDENSKSATLTDLGRFNVELGLAISEDDIEYYMGETLLPAAPTNAGDYTAKLTVTIDGADYTITKDYSIAKATPTPELPTGLTATYGDTLESVVLPAGWAWDDPADTSVGSAGDHTFAATFTPEDTDNYNTISAELTVAVAKAMPEYGIPEGITVLYGGTLADAVLPAGWAWVDPEDTSVGCLGDHTFSATFTPEDTDNYVTVTETLTLNVYTNYTFVPAKTPTCTQPGNTAYYKWTNRYYVVTEENELSEIELYTTVIPATGHVYGTSGDARFTCTVCGHVDQQRKADAEYEDMLPYYLAEFDACKAAVKEACDGRAMDGDTDECRALIANAKSTVDGIPFERGKSLEENKQAVYDVLDQLNRDLAIRRGAEKTGLCPLCGDYHNGSIIGILHAMIYVIKNFFEKLFIFR